jgi:hypothetical protein
MVKIQVIGTGFHPRVGFLPKLKPFYAEPNTIGWLLTDPHLKLKFYDSDASSLKDLDRKNYREMTTKKFTKAAPAVIEESVWKTTTPSDGGSPDILRPAHSPVAHSDASSTEAVPPTPYPPGMVPGTEYT